MPKYRKLPVVIEAVLYDWDDNEKCADEAQDEVADFMNANIVIDSDDDIEIETLEGTMYAKKGDYIIKGIAGEFYPCKADIFAKTYEQVNESVCTAPQDPNHVLTADEIKRLAETGSLCDCADFTQYGGDCPIEEGDEFDFGSALYLMQKGEKVMRAGWNGKGMFVCRILPSECSDLDGNEFEHSEYLVLKTADNKIVPWTISQTDALATDWCLA